jgi:peroxiredoxin
MNFLKSIYISAYVTCLAIASGHAAYGIAQQGLESIWSGVLIAVLPSFLFFVRLFVTPVARTSANLYYILIYAVLGSAIALYLSQNSQQTLFAALYSLGLGVTGGLIYIFWYSRLDRSNSDQLNNGNTLPSFTLTHGNDELKGQTWQSSELQNHPALLLFFRGNWCPLCMAQIKEVAAHYQQLEAMGVKVYLVSPQPEAQTQTLAKKFNVKYHFMVDKDNAAAKILGIEAKHGTPKGLEALGYESDTVLPTVIMTDQKGKIIFNDQTDNYRVRPEPETFIEEFEKHGITA